MIVCVAICDNEKPCRNRALFQNKCARHWFRDYKIKQGKERG